MSVLSLAPQIEAKPGRGAESRRVLTALVQPTRAEEGCPTYDPHVADDDPGGFLFYEERRTLPSWERYMSAPHLEAFRGRTDEPVAEWKPHRPTKIA